MRKNVLVLLGAFLFVFATFAIDRRIELEADLAEEQTRSMGGTSQSVPIDNVNDYVIATIDGASVNLSFGQLSGAYLTVTIYNKTNKIVYQNGSIAGNTETINLGNCLGGEYRIVITSQTKMCFRGYFNIE